ncbi:MAG: SHOCT domain-containing protein [Proteobacteria bacterium]|nr:SHOCT domain-containing protein [Pseudomonadota bacterium]
MNIKTKLITVLLSAVMFGCAGTPVHFSDAPIAKLDLSQRHKVRARAVGLLLFDFIPIGVNNRQAYAYELLKDEAGNNYLTNIAIQEVWRWVFIGHKYVTILTADAYPLAIDSKQILTDKIEALKTLYAGGEISEKEYEKARQQLLSNFLKQ